VILKKLDLDGRIPMFYRIEQGGLAFVLLDIFDSRLGDLRLRFGAGQDSLWSSNTISYCFSLMGRECREAAMLQCARFSSEPDLVKASSNSPPMRQGARGDGVRGLQMALIDLGFSMPISTNHGQSLPDGIFGSETANTVIAFQRANNLVPDGVVGKNTMAQLDALIAAQSDAITRTDVMSGNKSKGLS
jgi:hypothetical protein